MSIILKMLYLLRARNVNTTVKALFRFNSWTYPLKNTFVDVSKEALILLLHNLFPFLQYNNSEGNYQLKLFIRIL